MTGWIIGSVVLFAILWILRFIERSLIYFPSRKMELTPEEAGLSYEDIYFVAEDNVRLHGWWIPAKDAAGTVIMSHGNAGNIGGRLWAATFLVPAGINVFLFDYRGYGLSRGRPSENGLYRDARAAFEVVRARYGDAEAPPVAVFGRSLGGAVAVQLALDKPVRCLILESTFTSMVEMAGKVYPFLPARVLARDRFYTDRKLPLVKAPVLIAHSPYDELVPYEMGERLFRCANNPKQFIVLNQTHAEPGFGQSSEYLNASLDLLRKSFQ